MDFIQLLFINTDRCFSKKNDTLSTCIAVMALFVSLSAITLSLLTEFPTHKVVLKATSEIMLAIGIILTGYVISRHFKSNDKVFEIEKILFQKSQQLSQLDIG